MKEDNIKVLMINEVVPSDRENDFYSGYNDSEYANSIINIFNRADIEVNSMDDIEALGIYIINAVKKPKKEYTIPAKIIKEDSYIVESELDKFKNLKVIMLMGDVAQKSFDYIIKRKIKSNPIPKGSTYKIRKEEYFYNDILLIPSYIITGKNILIEKSKMEMVIEDINKMKSFIDSN